MKEYSDILMVNKRIYRGLEIWGKAIHIKN